MTNLI